MITVEEAFEAAKEKAEDYLRKMRFHAYRFGPDDDESYFIDGYRAALDADGDPVYPTTWMFVLKKPKEGDTTIKFAALPMDENGEKLRPVMDCWENYEAAPEDLAQRVIEEIRSLIEMAGGWKKEVMR
jgi:hypothetical protein